MKKYFFVILFFLVLVTPFVLRAVLGRSTEPTHDQGSLELIIITPNGEPIRREFEHAFSKYHREKFGKDVDINYLSYGGGVDMQRTLEGRTTTTFKQNGTYEIDLAWGGGDTIFNRNLKPFLEGFKLDPELMKRVFPKPTLTGVRLYEGSESPLWYGTALSSFGISYNRDVVKQLKLPEPATWSDLADRRFRKWIVLADPTRSSSALAAFMVIVERAMDIEKQALSKEDQANPQKVAAAEDIGWAKGMGLVRLIAANARNFNDSAQSLPSVISSGDVAAGMTIDFFARSQIGFVGDERMAYIEPVNATIINPDPIALIKGAQHREVAIRFIEFVLSDQGQRIWNQRAGTPGGPQTSSLRRLPISPVVYQDPRDFTDHVNPFNATGAFETDAKRKDTFLIAGVLIQASCIDLLDELRDTRDAVYESSKSNELDAKLGTFPFGRIKALEMQAQFAKANPVEKLELTRQWSNIFRDEYKKLRDAAD